MSNLWNYLVLLGVFASCLAVAGDEAHRVGWVLHDGAERTMRSSIDGNLEDVRKDPYRPNEIIVQKHLFARDHTYKVGDDVLEGDLHERAQILDIANGLVRTTASRDAYISVKQLSPYEHADSITAGPFLGIHHTYHVGDWVWVRNGLGSRISGKIADIASGRVSFAANPRFYESTEDLEPCFLSFEPGDNKKSSEQKNPKLVAPEVSGGETAPSQELSDAISGTSPPAPGSW